MSRATLLDVAKHCGVSRATVSLVLNNSPLVADATRARVQQGMADLGYVYNRAAASLRTHRSDAIGVVLTQITNPYFAEFAAGLQDTLTESGTVPLLGISNERPRSPAPTGHVPGRAQRGRDRPDPGARHHRRPTCPTCSARRWCCWLGTSPASSRTTSAP